MIFIAQMLVVLMGLFLGAFMLPLLGYAFKSGLRGNITDFAAGGFLLCFLLLAYSLVIVNWSLLWEPL